MGYYSEVAICMAFEDEAKRDAFWDLLSLRDDEIGHVIKNQCAKDDRMPWITFHDTGIKWYESLPTRRSFEDDGGIFELVIECGGAYRIMRIGEENDDVETNEDAADGGNVEVPWDAFYLNCSISWR